MVGLTFNRDHLGVNAILIIACLVLLYAANIGLNNPYSKHNTWIKQLLFVIVAVIAIKALKQLVVHCPNSNFYIYGCVDSTYRMMLYQRENEV